MNAHFLDLHAAADVLGPGVVECCRYMDVILDIVRRRGSFGRRIKAVPATGHPSRFFDRHQGDSARIERSAPLKAILAQVNQDLTIEPTSQVAFSRVAGLADSLDALMRLHDIALWLGSDTSLTAPTSPQYCGVVQQLANGGGVYECRSQDSIAGIMQTAVSRMLDLANGDDEVCPTAIYANPVLLDLLVREVEDHPRGVNPLGSSSLDHLHIHTLHTDAGQLPLIPEWALGYTGCPGSGSAVLPAYIVSEPLIEYHWLTDPNPRIFQLGLSGALAQQFMVVKFGAVVVKRAASAHSTIKVYR